MIEISPMIILPDFSAYEFNCPCCGLNNMRPVFLWKLQQCRTEAQTPFIITSGTRCEKHNKFVGGKLNSEHLTGEAVDILVNNPNERFKIIKFAIETGFKRIGIGKDFVHIGGNNGAPQQVIWIY